MQITKIPEPEEKRAALPCGCTLKDDDAVVEVQPCTRHAIVVSVDIVASDE